jgi:hypothetical protein
MLDWLIVFRKDVIDHTHACCVLLSPSCSAIHSSADSQILAREIVRYKAAYEEELEELKACESELRESTVYDIQAWWASTLAWRKARKRHERMLKSLYWYRIRRLVRLKKAVDKFNPVTQTMNDLEDVFCDLIPELREYRLLKKKKATRIANRWGFKLLAKARAKLSNGLWKVHHLFLSASHSITVNSPSQHLPSNIKLIVLASFSSNNEWIGYEKKPS